MPYNACLLLANEAMHSMFNHSVDCNIKHVWNNVHVRRVWQYTCAKLQFIDNEFHIKVYFLKVWYIYINSRNKINLKKNK